LYKLGQIVAWQYIPYPLDSNWPCTVINDHGNERCKQHTIHDSRGPENITTQSRFNEWNEEDVI